MLFLCKIHDWHHYQKHCHKELSPETNEFFEYMVERDLFDIEKREGKDEGGFCDYIPTIVLIIHFLAITFLLILYFVQKYVNAYLYLVLEVRVKNFYYKLTKCQLHKS